MIQSNSSSDQDDYYTSNSLDTDVEYRATIRTLEFVIDNDKEYSCQSCKYRHLKDQQELDDLIAYKANIITTELRDKFLPNREEDREPDDFLSRKFRIKIVESITEYKDFLLKTPYRKRIYYTRINIVYKTKDKKVQLVDKANRVGNVPRGQRDQYKRSKVHDVP